MFPLRKPCSAPDGLTLLELITVMLVVAILAVMLLPVFAGIRARADKAGCISNLRSLHVAADLYLQEHHTWPQVKSAGVSPEDLAIKWVATLRPYGLNEINWVCPTLQRDLQNPDLTMPDSARVDYAATPFDTNPTTPFKWATQPWFVESADVHGNGNLILFPDGHVQELGDYKASVKSGGSASATH